MKRSPMPRRRVRLVTATPLRPVRRGNRALAAARQVVRERAHDWCEIRVSGVCEGRGCQAHHRLRRSQGGPDVPDNLAWTCAACHRYVHSHIDWATAMGWLLRRIA